MVNKTLWISDLDGTLLNKEKKVSDYTKKILNEKIAEGLCFSIATARTPATVVDMLKGVEISVPVVVMNGAAVYNMATSTYEHVNYLETDMVKVIENLLKEKKQNAFTYCIDNNQLIAYHGAFTNEAQKKFYEERQNNPRKLFKAEETPLDARVAYFVVIGEEEAVRSIYEVLKGYDKVNQVFYEDIYNAGVYYLEIYSEEVSKANAIKFLKKTFGFDKLVCFGDNYNDIEMFEMADEGCAVANAVEKIKELSTQVIGHHNEDGVAKFIESKWQK